MSNQQLALTLIGNAKKKRGREGGKSKGMNALTSIQSGIIGCKPNGTEAHIGNRSSPPPIVIEVPPFVAKSSKALYIFFKLRDVMMWSGVSTE